MPQVHLSAAARRDLIDHYEYFEAEAGEVLAERFLREAEACLNLLATQPGMGAPVRLRSPELAEMRKWRIAGFDNVLMFYRRLADGVLVVRVLHAAQDWWRLLGLEH